jgi:predicted ATP-binding protein involved in virulence
MKFIPFILFTLLSCVSYAQENTQILIGQNGHKTAFILEVVGEENLFVNDKGEIYLKADNIVVVPKENLLNFMAASSVKELPLEQLAKDGDAKLKDLGVSDKLIDKVDSKQQRFQSKLEKQTAKMKLKKTPRE